MVAFVDPPRNIKLLTFNSFNNYRNDFLSRPNVRATPNSMRSSINLRERVRIPHFGSNTSRFNGFGAPNIDENTPLEVEVNEFNDELTNVLIGDRIRFRHLRDPMIWAQLLYRFPAGSVQTARGVAYGLPEDASDEQIIQFFKNRILEDEIDLIDRQFVKGYLTIPSNSKAKVLQSPYDINLESSDPNHMSKLETEILTKKALSLIIGVVTHRKISGKIKMLKTNLNSRKSPEIRYSNTMKALNYIYHYNLDLANNLARLCLNSDLLVVNNEDMVDHWCPVSELFLHTHYPDGIGLFKFTTDSTIRNDLISLIAKSQKISGYVIYLTRRFSEENYVVTGTEFQKWFAHIMDAAVHANIPGAFREKCIFMPYNRIQSLFNSQKKMALTVQENDFLEFILKQVVDAQGQNNIQNNFDSFMQLVFEKSIGPNALWISGETLGFLWKRTGRVDISPFIEKREKFLDGDTSIMEWNYLSYNVEHEMFIGSMAGDLRVVFPQLGLRGSNSLMVGDSESELGHQLQFQYYKVGDTYIQIKPGECILDNDGNVIGVPRFLMLKNQFEIFLSLDTFNIDTIIHISDLLLDGTRSRDHGKSFAYGSHGMVIEGYSDDKIRKIKESQDRGAPFISSIENTQVWNNFENSIWQIRHDSNHPFYDPYFASVFLMGDVFDKLVLILNNPADHGSTFEELIDEITLQIVSEEDFETYKGLTREDCVNIAKAFGKAVDMQGNVILQSLDEAGNVLLDARGQPIMLKWWINFHNSNIPNSFYYQEQSRILRGRMFSIKGFYNQINSNHVPDWVEHFNWNILWTNL